MRHTLPWLLAGAMVVTATTATSLAADFRFERHAVPGAVGANRLAPDAVLLSGGRPLRYDVTTTPARRGGSDSSDPRLFVCRGGLEDLRLFDEANREVPYLLLMPQVAWPDWRSASILPIAATKKTSGFEADLGTVVVVDAMRLDGIAAPFLKRLQLEGSGDREHWTLLTADTTIFDLPDQQLRHTEIGFTPGAYRYLRVTFDDANSARVVNVGSAAARLHTVTTPPPATVLPTTFVRRSSEPGKSRYQITLPGSQLPVAAIELRVANGNVYRNATILEPRLTGSQVVPESLGTARLRRAEREGAVAADLTIPITFPQGPDLDLVVDDANNPPLDITAIVARLAPLPSIYFESADGTPIVARYGNETLAAPVYDLEASRRVAATAPAVEAKWTSAPAAAKSNGAEEGIPLAGAPIDRDPFRYNRSIPSAPRGLTSLLLDVDALSHSAALNDLRIVDAHDNQIPYLVEQRAAPLTLPLTIPSRQREGTQSLYRIQLPYDSLPADTKVVLTTTARVFDRHVIVRKPADDRRNREPEPLAELDWKGIDPALPAPALTVDCCLAGTKLIEVVIDEGDNAPIPITSGHLVVPSFALRFYDPGTPLTLLYGNPTLAPPRYDLALLAPRLFGESAREVVLTSRAADAPESDRVERKAFWVVIALAVIVLLVMLARLVRAHPPSEES